MYVHRQFFYFIWNSANWNTVTKKPTKIVPVLYACSTGTLLCSYSHREVETISPSLEFKFSPVICLGQREFHKLYTSWSLKSPLKGVCLLWLGNPGPTLLWTNTGDFAGWWGRYSQAIPTAPASNKSTISLDHSRPSPDARNLRWHQLKQPRQKELPSEMFAALSH